MKQAVKKRGSERGGAGVKLLIVVVGLILVANAGYQWIPIAYAGENFKQDIQTAVVQGFAAAGGRAKPVDIVKAKIAASAQSNNIPEDAIVDIRTTSNSLLAHVTYTKEVPLLPFGIYNYQYQFDYTATPSGFLTKD